ncbi:MAG: 1,4-alpha-glucan branching protein GlgB [Nevskia sp.]|nr:1,4-alpha-glucan branching protein GlgB [Nevskia sp.]
MRKGHQAEPPFDAAAAAALVRGELKDPFAVLGPHRDGAGVTVRAFLPGAEAVEAVARDGGASLGTLLPVPPEGLFAGRLQADTAYSLRIRWPSGMQETEDPYAFGLLLGEMDLHLLAEGRHQELGRCLGAHPMTVDGVAGVRFAVWAPNARRVAVIGDFNGWDSRRHGMRLRHDAGVWELFVPRLGVGEVYKYEVLGADGGRHLKADPVAWCTELPPATASVVADTAAAFRWTDQKWLESRRARQSLGAPISIYEVHVGSWQRDIYAGGRWLNWDELAQRLVPYVADLGFTHIELLPIMEHPFGGSWGYQPLAMFAPTARYGTPEGFARFVDACHAANIGVLLDWVPAHFPSDSHGLGRFDGTALYEYADPREGLHPDWGTLIYNFGRHEVAGFLIGSALHWIEHYHVDGLRVDAVASMLYRDYSRNPGEWVPNVHGGRENLDAVEFVRRLNQTVAQRCPGAIVVAEESTSWPGVTRDPAYGGLGFAYKWNMGWMHDTLHYMKLDPVYRGYHDRDLTFGLMYAFSEHFMLPLSHDEVVHLKRSLFSKMSGDRWQQFANLRAYLGLMWGYPGKKLLFMGAELAQEREWDHDSELQWHLLADPRHRGVQNLVRDLNRLYVAEPALHAGDCHGHGFRWVVVDDRENCVFAWLRHDPQGGTPVLVVCNMTPVPRHHYRVGVPQGGRWRELLNTDAGHYAGSNMGNAGAILAETDSARKASHGLPESLVLTLPPLATLMLRPETP